MKAKYHHQKQSSANGKTFPVVKIFLCLLLLFLVIFLGALFLNFEQRRGVSGSLASATNAVSTNIPSRVSVSTAAENIKPLLIKSTTTEFLRGKSVVDEKVVLKSNINNGDSYFVNMTVSSAGEIGTVILKVSYLWAPLGARRFRELVEDSYYNNAKFFRVIKKFMAQVGIHADPAVTSKWQGRSIPDDPIGMMSNKRGTFSFATSGPNTRVNQVFFNFVNNAYLDKEGFTPVGEVVQGMQYIDGLYSGYGEGGRGDGTDGKGPSQGRLNQQGNKYLDEFFPKLSTIVEAKVVDASDLSDIQ